MTTASPSTKPVTDSGAASARAFNFSAGPAILPEPVLRQAQRDLWTYGDTGVGIMEHSHRGAAFEGVITEAEADCRTLAGLGDDHAVLFLQGGASTQFSLLAMNFLPAGRTADYLDTGVWASKAISEAKRLGTVNVAFDGSTAGYDHCPTDDEITPSADAAYLHYCSNNTIAGTRFNAPPSTSVPLVTDTSSEMFSRRYDYARHAMIYAGAQKNLGPAGVVLVIIRRDFLERGADGLPSMFDYRKQAEKGSMYNTPPTFGIYVMGQVFKWILDQGGLDAVEQANELKAGIVYDAIDGSGGFYTGVARPESRSRMNVSFRTRDAELDARFVSEAAAEGLSGLKGHRSVGGLRASIYNAFPKAGCTALAEFMNEFARRNG